MKNKNIILTALTAVFAFSASMFAAFGGIKAVQPSVKAEENDNVYWEQYFDVESEGTVTFTSNTAAPAYQGSINTSLGNVATGLGINFTKDVTLTYKTPILLEALTKDTSIIEFYPAPVTPTTKSGETTTDSSDCEFSKTIITLENIEDPSQYVKIYHFRSSYNPGLGWYLVETNTMAAGGVKKGVLDKTQDKGTPCNSTYTGANKNATSVMYDYSTQTIMTNLPLYNEESYGAAKGTIRQLSNPNHLSGSDSVFLGFNGDYVRLSVTFTEISKLDQPANVILTNVLDQPLQGETFIDNGKPYLSFPTEIAEIPVGEKDTKYPFWDVLGFDAIEGNITSKMAYDIKYLGLDGNSAESNTNYEVVDGGFIPKATGFYKVSVNLEDGSNNKADSIVKTVRVLPVVESINFDLNGTIPTTASVGQKITIPNYAVSGGSGDLDIDFSVTYNNRSEEVEVVNNVFAIEFASVYNVTYVITDYLGDQRVFDYAISASLSDAPIVQPVVIPSYMKKNNYINLNMPIAYDYASFPGQKIEVPVTMEVAEVTIVDTVEKTGTYKAVTANDKGEYQYKPSANAVAIKVRYKANAKISNAEVVTEPNVINIIAPENNKLEQYWVNSDGKITSAYELVPDGIGSVENYFYVNEDGATLDYLIPVQGESFSLAMSFEENSAFFNKIKIVLQDSVNLSESVTFTITKRDENSVFLSSYGNNYANTSGQINNVTGISTVFFKFKVGRQIVDSVGSTIFNLTNYDDGSDYAKFTSGKIYVKVVFEDVDIPDGAVNKVRFGQFYSQNAYSEDAMDIGKPVIAPATHIATYYNYLEKITIPSAKAYDLYSPNVDTFVTVKDPNGNVILNNVKADNDHELVLDKSGRYVIEYSATDERNLKRYITYNVNTLDVVKPVIEINGQIKTTVKVGQVLELPDYYVTDNMSQGDKILRYVYLETPTFGYKTIAIGNHVGTYKFQQAGTYKLVYFAMDEASNYVYKTFTITVIA